MKKETREEGGEARTAKGTANGTERTKIDTQRTESLEGKIRSWSERKAKIESGK